MFEVIKIQIDQPNFTNSDYKLANCTFTCDIMLGENKYMIADYIINARTLVDAFTKCHGTLTFTTQLKNTRLLDTNGKCVLI